MTRHTGTILAVDDSGANLRLLVETLAPDGHTVLPANSGLLALAAATAHTPDLILLDMRMPVLDGLEVCRRLKARPETRDIPILLVSAFGEKQERLDGFALGAVDFISRPIEGEELRARVRAHLELRNLRAQAERQASALRDANERLQEELARRVESEERVRALNEQLESAYRATLSLMADVSRGRDELQAANRELDAFASSVSHDLRSPLRAMQGFGSALLTGYRDKLDAQGQHYIERIQAAATRMALLIDDLLNLSRIMRTDLTNRQVDLTGMACEIVHELQGRDAARRAHVSVADAMLVEGDPRLLRIALQNLLENAWKFTGTRALATIEVGMERAPSDGTPTYYVRDDGVGFDMAYADKLFTPFQRLHGAADFPGTGIGLATVQRVVLRHGGRIWLESALNLGTTVRFTLQSAGTPRGTPAPAGAQS